MILIWLVQLIIYPGFRSIASEEFKTFHRWYVQRISSVVIPLMTAELILTVWWVLSDDYSVLSILTGVLILVVWLSTFALQVPIHNRLKAGKAEGEIQRLVATNWIRTAAWSLKAATVSIDTLGRTL
jgi:glucose-6-phosphate dehydrogenase assembly protein OpcA